MTQFGWRSANWSGYVKYLSDPEYFSSIKAAWTVPAIVSNPADPSARVSIWIGIGGAQVIEGRPDVPGIIQIGTEARYDPSPPHNPIYFAWWETRSMPGDEGTTSPSADYPVKPGDRIEAYIVQNLHLAFIKAASWTINISNLTQGWNFNKFLTYDLDQQTAEFIVEAPQDRNKNVYPLADFNQVTFNDCLIDISGIGPNFSIADGGFMIDLKSGNTIAMPSVPNNNNFTVAYGATEPPAPN
ncbi:G1 family endopeptidase [Bacillus cereus]|nr:G1 family endopeptidase [Bacillus cereus]